MDEQKPNLEDVRLVLEQALEIVSPYEAWTVGTELDRDKKQVCSIGALKLAQIGGWGNVKNWYSQKTVKLCYGSLSFHHAVKLVAQAIKENHPRMYNRIINDEFDFCDDNGGITKFEDMNLSDYINVITGFNDRSYYLTDNCTRRSRVHGDVIDVFAKALKSVIQEMEEVSA
jgi:hypothetical protein